MQEKDEGLDEGMTLLTRNCKRALKKVGANPSKRQEKEGKELNRDLKSKEKENSKDKIHCFKCNGLGHMMHEC